MFMGWYHDGMGWANWLVMALSMAAFWTLVIFAVAAIFRSNRDTTGKATGQQDPLDILDQRFARGEIDESEYHTRAAVLRSAAPRT